MFNFSTNENKMQLQALQNEMNETQNRFFAFVEKLEIRMKEFTQESIPELTALSQNDDDNFKTGNQRLKSAVLGQLNSIRQKANDVLEEKIDHFQHIAQPQNRDAF